MNRFWVSRQRREESNLFSLLFCFIFKQVLRAERNRERQREEKNAGKMQQPQQSLGEFLASSTVPVPRVSS